MKYKAVIFDLDGVICHTDQYHYIHYSHCYSIEETVIKLRMLKIKKLRQLYDEKKG
jgi:beta-phosphoglucomutase-like phosphatase (HAD superfamily)